MIKVTRFNGTEFYLNAFHIESIEETPDTVITLFNGRKIVVKEKVNGITEEIENYFGKIGITVMRNLKIGGEKNGG